MSSESSKIVDNLGVAGCYHPHIDSKNFSFLEPITRDKKVIFIAESRHYVPEFKETLFDIALYLHRHAELRVVALESLYGLHPFLEDASLGKIPVSETPSGSFEGKIAEYNRELDEESKLLVTSIDIEHSINHTKDLTVKYLSYLAELATWPDVALGLKEAITRLYDLKERNETHAYLNDLAERFERSRAHFPDHSIEEIGFSLELMHASVDYQLLPREESVEFEEIRGKYFRATIQRALAKAEARNGSLLCFVGATHAVKTPKPADEPWCGQWTEACYFAQEYPKTTGKTASILLCVATHKGQSSYSEDIGPLEKVYLDSAPQSKMSFLDLSGQDINSLGLVDSKYVSQHGPKFDGILFFWDVTSL